MKLARSVAKRLRVRSVNMLLIWRAEAKSRIGTPRRAQRRAWARFTTLSTLPSGVCVMQ
jgi:hypothetical protein